MTLMGWIITLIRWIKKVIFRDRICVVRSVNLGMMGLNVTGLVELRWWVNLMMGNVNGRCGRIGSFLSFHDDLLIVEFDLLYLFPQSFDLIRNKSCIV